MKKETKKFMMNMDVELRRKIKLYCVIKNISMTDLITQLLEKELHDANKEFAKCDLPW